MSTVENQEKANTDPPSSDVFTGNNGTLRTWTRSLLEFSQGWTSLALSLAILIIAFVVHRYTDDSFATHVPIYVSNYATYAQLGPKPKLAPTAPIYRLDDSNPYSLLNATVLESFRNDGVICIRGLLSEKLMERLDVDTSAILTERLARGGPKKNSQFHTVEHSAMFRNISSNARRIQDFPALLQAAVFSNISRVAAELLGLVTTSNSDNASPIRNLRVIRDIFLAKDNEEYTCGWHVDDMGFWPATPESPGVNAWVALDDMEVSDETGGLALAVASHTAPWRKAAYYWTGASTNFPSNGYKDAADMFQRRTGHGTCNLKSAAPHLHQRMEETARIYPVRRGDVIFHTRWLFHKTVPMMIKKETNRILRRYSIRYGPGDTTILPPGYGMEPSILWKPSNGGTSLDEVSQTDGPWYPLAWPHIAGDDHSSLSTFARDLASLCEHELPVALKRKHDRVKEMKPFLRQLAKLERSKK